jgi:alkylation response protein AidB-like acyl-CoA dehydrogenase
MLRTFLGPQASTFREEVRSWTVATAKQPPWTQLPLLPDDHPDMLTIRRAWDRHLWESGWAGLSWPEEHGGRGLGPIEEVIFQEECARALLPQPANTIGTHLAGPAVLAHGTPEQRATLIRPILTAQHFWCEGFSEPEAGSDLAAVRTRAEPTAHGWAIHGQKIWTSFATYADYCYLLARTGAGSRKAGLSIFLVDMHSPGIDIHPIRQLSGHAQFSQVFFDTSVPESSLLGEIGEGWALSSLVGSHRVGGAALGASARWGDICRLMDRLEGCCARFGTTTTAEQISAAAQDVEALKWQIRIVTELAMAGRALAAEQSTLKLIWSRLLQDCSSLGVDSECPEHSDFWREIFLDLRRVTIAGGTSQILRNVLATNLLGLPR